MTRQEIARLGGQALAAKVSTEYFSFIGRRGGRRTKRNEIIAFASDLATTEPDRAEIWVEKADRYLDHTLGNRVMVELWTKDNCPPRPRRRRANTEDVQLRRWEKAVQAW